MLGLGLSFTPYVFPMIPILSGILAGQGEKLSTKKAFLMSLVYVESMALTYALLGVAVASAGSSLSGYFQAPGFVIGAAVIFVFLALAMFGFFELKLPRVIEEKVLGLSNKQQGGSYVGVGVMGVLSTLIVSPCVTAPLAGALIYVAKSGDWLIGCAALFALANGMGLLLLVVGTSGGALLPRAGAWMDGVKAVFGVAMLAVGLYIIKHLLPAQVNLLLWAALFIVSAVYLGALSSVDGGWKMFRKGLGLCMLLYGFVLIVGAGTGGGKITAPLENLVRGQFGQASVGGASAEHDDFIIVRSIADVEKEIIAARASGKTVMLDFYAEWCSACLEFKEYTFPDQRVRAALKNTVLLQADHTDNDAMDVAMQKHFDVLGLPTILFFDSEGKELRNFRTTGFENAETFARRLEAAL